MKHALAVLSAALVAASVIIVITVVFEPTNVQAGSSYDGNVRACNGKTVYLRPAEKRTLRLHNKTRVNRGKPRLCIQQQLLKAARKHSADMIRKDYFSHRSRNGTTFGQRVRRAGYTSRGTSMYLIRENISWGSHQYRKPINRHRAWMNSPVHRRNILDGRLRQVGIGVANGKFKAYRPARMYTVDFGLRRR